MCLFMNYHTCVFFVFLFFFFFFFFFRKRIQLRNLLERWLPDNVRRMWMFCRYTSFHGFSLHIKPYNLNTCIICLKFSKVVYIAEKYHQNIKFEWSRWKGIIIYVLYWPVLILFFLFLPSGLFSVISIQKIYFYRDTLRTLHISI